MSSINNYLNTFQFSEYHETKINKGAEDIFPIIRNTNFNKSKLINFLFAIRGLPKKTNSLNGFLDVGFILLEEKENEEIVIGFLFGITAIEIKQIPSHQFATFSDKKYIKGVWNFKLTNIDSNSILSTETRVFCPTIISKIFFSVYWFCIKYFSGLVRIEILKLIKSEAEQTS